MGTRYRIVSSLMLAAVALSLATNAGAAIAQTHV
jgi:hypothetical protein